MATREEVENEEERIIRRYGLDEVIEAGGKVETHPDEPNNPNSNKKSFYDKNGKLVAEYSFVRRISPETGEVEQEEHRLTTFEPSGSNNYPVIIRNYEVNADGERIVTQSDYGYDGRVDSKTEEITNSQGVKTYESFVQHSSGEDGVTYENKHIKQFDDNGELTLEENRLTTNDGRGNSFDRPTSIKHHGTDEHGNPTLQDIRFSESGAKESETFTTRDANNHKISEVTVLCDKDGFPVTRTTDEFAGEGKTTVEKYNRATKQFEPVQNEQQNSASVNQTVPEGMKGADLASINDALKGLNHSQTLNTQVQDMGTTHQPNTAMIVNAQQPQQALMGLA